jgi:hypothetical protein
MAKFFSAGIDGGEAAEIFRALRVEYGFLVFYVRR